MSEELVLETVDLTKHYGGVHALEGASFQLKQGEHVAIMGDNGCLLYTSPSPRDLSTSRMPSSA